MSIEEEYALVPVGQDLVEMDDEPRVAAEPLLTQLARGLGSAARLVVNGLICITGGGEPEGVAGCEGCAHHTDAAATEEFRELLADLGEQISLHRDKEQVLYEDRRLWEVIDRLRQLGPRGQKVERR